MIKVNLIRTTLTERILGAQPDEGYNSTLLEEEHVRVYDFFEKQYVSNILTPIIVSYWYPEDGGRFISSPTGTGKTNLIIKLRKLAKERGCRIIIITPRAALSLQYKKDLIKAYDKELGEKYTDLGLHDLTSIDCFDVFTAQALSSPGIQNHLIKNRDRYGFVIIDEIHEFISDAEFNPYTALYFDFIINRIGVDAVRIYLTATPEKVIKHVVEAENKIAISHRIKRTCFGSYIPKEFLTVYRFKKDFSYVNLHFFKDAADIPSLIGNPNDREKSLIFVVSKECGLRLKDSIEKKGHKAQFLTAESKTGQDSLYYTEMIDSSQFSSSVLIATKFLDVGINLKDSALKNVFICSLYRDEIEQMLGRKRLLSATETINLFLMLPTKAQLSRMLFHLREQFDSWAQTKSNMPNRWDNFTEVPFPYFASQKGEKIDLNYNRFSFDNNLALQAQLQALLGSDDRECQEKYIQMIQNLLPGANICHALEEKTEIEVYLDSLIGLDLSREDYLAHCKFLLSSLGIHRDKDQENDVPTGTLNKALKAQGLSYCAVSLSREGKKQMWKFERGN